MAWLIHRLFSKKSGEIEVESFKEAGPEHPARVSAYIAEVPHALNLTPREAIRLGAMFIACGESVLADEEES